MDEASLIFVSCQNEIDGGVFTVLSNPKTCGSIFAPPWDSIEDSKALIAPRYSQHIKRILI